MRESFLSGFGIGEKAGKSIRQKGLIDAMWNPPPDEIIHLSGHVLVDALNCTGFLIGCIHSAPDALLFPEIVLPPESTHRVIK